MKFIAENTVMRRTDSPVVVRRENWNEEAFPWQEVINGSISTVKYQNALWIVSLNLFDAQSVTLTRLRDPSNFTDYSEG